MTLQRLTALRALMASQPTALAAYIVPTADAHNSEYIAPVDARREWISGFTGSAGTAVVTSSHALVWTDGRYYTQFEKEVDLTMWTLMKQSLPDTPSIEKWLSSNLSDGAVVGVDPHTMTREEWSPIQSVLSKANMRFVAVPMNLVDEVRVLLNDLPPARPHNDIMPLPVKYTGQTTGAKIEELRKNMAEKKASSLVITALDEVAYTLNLRGSDIEFNPVFFSYLVITPSAVKMFWWDGKLPSVVIDHLKEEGVGDFEVLKYNSIVDYLESEALKLSETGDGQHAVWLSSEASEAIHRAASGSDLAKKPLNLISEVSPVALAKLVKNHVELEGFRQCHVRDGVAVTRLLRWLHLQIDAGVEVTEIQVADRLLEFRKEESDFMGPSFETIAGAGENGAVIHYTPHRGGEQRVVTSTDMFLLDSGGQYRDGTTDITRTRHMGRAPSAEQKGAFTRVLKGQIMLGSALFPKGVKGNVLDSFARKALWDVGLDYAHGTGHGVGHFLNVHEGPSGVSWRPYPRDPGLAPRQVLSNEPGYYKVGEYGIRHEDLVETIDVTKDSSHPRAMNLIGEFEGRGVLGFRTLTLVPNQRECIDVALLDQFELHYTNEYHQRVLDTLGPILKARGLTEDCEWLEAECAPITRKPIFTECFTTNMAWGHIPMRYFNSAEPDAPIYEPDPSVTKLSRQTAWDRLNAVRSVLSPSGVYAYIVPTADAHNSQYIAPAEARREWLSGLQGSSGTAVVTARKALLWTDARYFTQFYVQVDTTHWELMRQGTDLSVTQWLVENLPAESVVGIDPTTYTRSAWTPLENALRQANITLLATSENLVDLARVSINDSPPSRPSNDLLPLTSNYTGRPAGEKVAELMAQMQTRGASALVLTALDEVAYTLNLRGSDIPYNPVFFAYLLIRTDVVASNVILFWNDGQLSSEVVQHLSSQDVQVEARPYAEIFQYLRTFTVELPYESAVWLSEDASHAINLAVENDGENGALNILSTVSPVALMKVVKNQVELQGFRNAHIKDGVAVVRALFWVHQQVDAGVNVTEVQLSNKMRDLRADEIDFMGPSFATIAGAGQNGAIIHYKPSDVGEQTVIRKEDMLLVDSGGQYKDGTTDITRTRHMSSSPTAAQRRAFTRVLKGQINLGTAVFPSGTQGHVIEVLARKALWDVGLNYGHGTGHGVGHYLNVHEGPTWILSGPAANDPGIRPNMIYSNEPGYYEVGEYGIRHEDLVETISITRDADHQLAAGMVADFEGRGAVGFYTISLAPHQTACLDVDLLTDFEITYINEYHARVLSTLGPILQARGLSQESEWLESECAPIGRSAAILFTLSPILAVVSVLRIVLA